MTKDNTNNLQHISDLIGSLEYGKLKKSGIVPNMVMFTGVPRLGGIFPNLSKKVDSWWFGYLMDRVVRTALQCQYFDEELLGACLDEIVDHTNEKQCSWKSLRGEFGYYEDIAEWVIDELNVMNDDEVEYEIEYEPEWVYDSIMGHPDLVIDDTIYDVKMTGRWGRMRISTIFQLLSYAALAQVLGKNVKYVGVILPAQRIIERYDIRRWNGRKFLRLLTDKAMEKNQRERVSLELLEEFEGIQNCIGSHVSRQSTLRKTLESWNPKHPMQIFLAGRMKLTHKISDRDMAKSLEYIRNHNMRVFVHMPYNINISRLCFKPRYEGDEPEVVEDVLAYHLEATAQFGGSGAVVHLGQKADMSEDEAHENMFMNVIGAAAYATPECPLLLETDSGGSILDDPSDLAEFWLALDEEMQQCVAVCLDTCHVFAAGYDNLETLKMFRERGVPVRLIHFNDSKYAKGSRKDRHAYFGRGLIGHAELIAVAKYAMEHDIPMVYE